MRPEAIFPCSWLISNPAAADKSEFREEGLILTVRLNTGYRIAAQSTPSGPISESVKEVQRSLRPLHGGKTREKWWSVSDSNRYFLGSEVNFSRSSFPYGLRPPQTIKSAAVTPPAAWWDALL